MVSENIFKQKKPFLDLPALKGSVTVLLRLWLVFDVSENRNRGWIKQEPVAQGYEEVAFDRPGDRSQSAKKEDQRKRLIQQENRVCVKGWTGGIVICFACL
jgi:hypothetical protein